MSAFQVIIGLDVADLASSCPICRPRLSVILPTSSSKSFNRFGSPWPSSASRTAAARLRSMFSRSSWNSVPVSANGQVSRSLLSRAGLTPEPADTLILSSVSP